MPQVTGRLRNDRAQFASVGQVSTLSEQACLGALVVMVMAKTAKSLSHKIWLVYGVRKGAVVCPSPQFIVGNSARDDKVRTTCMYTCRSSRVHTSRSDRVLEV